MSEHFVYIENQFFITSYVLFDRLPELALTSLLIHLGL